MRAADGREAATQPYACVFVLRAVQFGATRGGRYLLGLLCLPCSLLQLRAVHARGMPHAAIIAQWRRWRSIDLSAPRRRPHAHSGENTAFPDDQAGAGDTFSFSRSSSDRWSGTPFSCGRATRAHCRNPKVPFVRSWVCRARFCEASTAQESIDSSAGRDGRARLHAAGWPGYCGQRNTAATVRSPCGAETPARVSHAGMVS